MRLAFEIEHVVATEFGLGRAQGNNPTFTAISVDEKVQAALRKMVQVTWNLMQMDDKDGPGPYQPSEKHSGTEYLFVAPSDDIDTAIRELHDAHNLPMGPAVLTDLNEVFCYFARFTDGQGQRLTAMRRASHFKGVLEKQLLHFVTDQLKIVEDKVFKLDSDFDLLIDSDYTHIWRPNAFESLCGLKQLILDAVPDNVATIQRDIDFMNFTVIQDYASTHPRAASHLASIRKQNLVGITRESLESLCRSAGVKLEESNGMAVVADKDVMDFLEALDRRRYQVEVVPSMPERFRATSRRRIGA